MTTTETQVNRTSEESLRGEVLEALLNAESMLRTFRDTSGTLEQVRAMFGEWRGEYGSKEEYRLGDVVYFNERGAVSRWRRLLERLRAGKRAPPSRGKGFYVYTPAEGWVHAP